MNILSDEFPKESSGDVGLYSMKVEYTQDADSCNPTKEDIHTLTVWTENSGAGSYIVFKTDRWAVDMDSIDEIVKVLQDFKTRFGK